ncbi:MAG: putative CDP-diacylglycerol--glycerol-3-phosphate 3-phosphatidyl-transferase 2 [Acidimicrobiales bacterium]|nr:MAG: CDP-alcohol phosphatidyltransferase family protein [Actinomycetota bacterium]MBV6509153.1 putative CDP-diacylglycerol--glycerol-3-phosphate 3-phosphatidyl-transferase 2 [Acidimicrobiales bacterium]RIK08500.1 MAG: hypothetical protein DCC48_00685 [Acidobacteriota bacterium]
MTDTGYGPSALATPANAITVARLLLAPVAFAMIVAQPSSWPLVGLWFVLSVTDLLDGYFARRHGTTRSGAFLDPLADKVLVIGGMSAMVAAGKFSWAPVALTIVREVGISVFRSYWGRRGLAVPARRLAKYKTFLQLSAVGWVTLPLTTDLSWLYNSFLWASVLLAWVSGAQYLLDGGKATRSMEPE